MSDSTYEGKLSYLISLEPDNPHIAKLRTGNTHINSFLLEKEFSRLPPPVKMDLVPKRRGKQDPILQKLSLQLRNLYSNRAKLSNQYHIAGTVEERKQINRKIRQIIDDMEVVAKNIEYYLEKNEIADLPISNKYPVPSTYLECYKKNHSIRTSIRSKEKHIETLLKQGADQLKIEESEAKLRELKIHKAYVEKELQRYQIGESS